MKHWIALSLATLWSAAALAQTPAPAKPATPAKPAAAPAKPAAPPVELPFQATVPEGYSVEKTLGPDGQGIFFRKGAGYVHIYLPSGSPDPVAQKAEAERFCQWNGWKSGPSQAPAAGFSSEALNFDSANRSGTIYVGTIEGKPARVTVSAPKSKPPATTAADAQPLLNSLTR